MPNGQLTSCTTTAALEGATTTYTCPLNGDYNPDCPPTGSTQDGASGGGGSAGTGGTSDGVSGSGGGSAGTGGSSGGASGTGGIPGGTAGSGGTADGMGGFAGGGNGTGGYGNGSGGAANGGSAGSAGTSDGTAGGAGDCRGNGAKSCDNGGSGGPPGGSGGPPGGPGGSTGAGGSPGSSGGSGNGGSGGGGGGFTCTPDASGAVTCTHTDCVPGTTPLPCGACAPTIDVGTADCVPPQDGGCWITGGGFITDADGTDSFGGNGMPMKDGRIRGQWEHQDHGTGNNMHGEVNYLVCRHVDEPGPGQPSGPSHHFNINQAYYGGPARWASPNGNWQDGYWFDVMAEDHGEPGNKPGPGQHGSGGPDFYHITIRKMAGQNQSGTVVYDTQGDFDGGNFQIHPPNNGHPYTSSSLPSWVSLQP